MKLQLTVRTYKKEVRDHIIAAIPRIARGLAAARGLPEERMPVVKVMEEESIPSTFNDPALTERLVRVWTARLGEANVRHVDPVMGGEDFGLYALPGNIPAMILWVGAVDPAKIAAAEKGGAPLPSLHSPLFAPVPEPAIRTGAHAMVSAALELMK